MAKKRRRSRGTPDVHAARDLMLTMESDSTFIRQRTIPVMQNQARRLRKGQYNPRLAMKLWGYWADDAAKKYCKDNHCTWNVMFTTATRRRVARLMAQEFRKECQSPHSSNDLPSEVAPLCEGVSLRGTHTRRRRRR